MGARLATMPSIPNSNEDSGQASTLLARPPKQPPGPVRPGTALYVHLPFCVVKCPYCDFFSVESRGQDRQGTLEAILAEARLRAPQDPVSLFLGGGTPSLLNEKELCMLLDGLDAICGWRASACEVTAECNPESLDGPKARQLVELGVGRLSLGLQSLDPNGLRFLGRAHDRPMALAAYEAARSTSAEVNVDMIYALPGQSLAMWEAELAEVLALNPDHLSAYNLTFEAGTQLELRRSRGEVVPADEEVELACFNLTRELAATSGLEAYEISNYARPGMECQHNLTYWANGEYVGLGPGASSYVNRVRCANPRGLAPYLRWVASDGHATLTREELSGIRRLGETWWLGLRRVKGVEPGEAIQAAGLTMGQGSEAEWVQDPALALAHDLAKVGLLESHQGRWRLTPAGWPLADGVARQFLELNDSNRPSAPTQPTYP